MSLGSDGVTKCDNRFARSLTLFDVASSSTTFVVDSKS